MCYIILIITIKIFLSFCKNDHRIEWQKKAIITFIIQEKAFRMKILHPFHVKIKCLKYFLNNPSSFSNTNFILLILNTLYRRNELFTCFLLTYYLLTGFRLFIYLFLFLRRIKTRNLAVD